MVQRLQDWGLHHLADSAALMTSELATNAITHTDQPFAVAILRRDSAVRVEVADASPALPQVPAHEPGTPSTAGDLFSGLGLVDAVATAWGSDPADDGGKVVWFELSIAGAFSGDGEAQSSTDQFDDALHAAFPVEAMHAALHSSGEDRPILPVPVIAALVVAVMVVVVLGLWAGGVLGAVWYGH